MVSISTEPEPKLMYSWGVTDQGTIIEVATGMISDCLAFSLDGGSKCKVRISFSKPPVVTTQFLMPTLVCKDKSDYVIEANVALPSALRDALASAKVHELIFEHPKDLVSKELRRFLRVASATAKCTPPPLTSVAEETVDDSSCARVVAAAAGVKRPRENDDVKPMSVQDRIRRRLLAQEDAEHVALARVLCTI